MWCETFLVRQVEIRIPAPLGKKKKNQVVKPGAKIKDSLSYSFRT